MINKILDLSYYDGRQYLPTFPTSYAYHPLNWALAKTKWAGAIVKASQGIYTDPLYRIQVQEMADAGVPFGSYHYFDGSMNAITSAHDFCDLLETSGGYGSLGVWLDAEVKASGISDSSYLNAVGSWLYEVNGRMTKSGSSSPLGIYTRGSFIDPIWINSGKPSWLSKYPGWLAGYAYDKSLNFATQYANVMTGISRPPLPISQAIPTIFCHQWTARGDPRDVPGYPPYKKAVDFNLWYGLFPGVPIPPVTATIEQRLSDLEKRVSALEHPS